MSVLTTIARGDGSHVSEPRRVVARTGDEWRTLWATHAGPGGDAPDVDMTSVNVAAVFAGEKPTAGYDVEIVRADTTDGGIALVVEEKQPPPGGVSAQIMTSPFHVVSVPKGLEITWASDDAERGSGTGERGSEVGKTSVLSPDPRSPIADFRPPVADHPSSTGLEPRMASALAYLAGPFSGALILLSESTNQTVRFHAWQSIVGLGGIGLAILGSYLLAFVALFISATAVSLMVGVAAVIWIVLALVWVICLWKAWSGGRWKLPIVGDYAERFR
jgi:uncharacterized membrane protein